MLIGRCQLISSVLHPCGRDQNRAPIIDFDSSIEIAQSRTNETETYVRGTKRRTKQNHEICQYHRPTGRGSSCRSVGRPVVPAKDSGQVPNRNSGHSGLQRAPSVRTVLPRHVPSRWCRPGAQDPRRGRWDPSQGVCGGKAGGD